MMLEDAVSSIIITKYTKWDLYLLRWKICITYQEQSYPVYIQWFVIKAVVLYFA